MVTAGWTNTPWACCVGLCEVVLVLRLTSSLLVVTLLLDGVKVTG